MASLVLHFHGISWHATQYCSYTDIFTLHPSGTNFDLHLPQHFAFVESGLPKTSQRDEEEDVGCSSRASPRDFIGPLPALSEAAAQEADEGQGQAPVFQINKMPDLIN